MDRPASDSLDDPGHVPRMLRNRHVARGVLGCAGAAMIRYDHLVTLGEQIDLRPPRRTHARKPRQK